jgi:excisionase family DNA binding protein
MKNLITNTTRPKMSAKTATLVDQAIREFPEIEPKSAAEWELFLSARCQLYPRVLQPWFQGVDMMELGFVTVREAASFLRIGRTKVYDLMDGQDLPYVKMGKTRRIPKVALKLFAEKG